MTFPIENIFYYLSYFVCILLITPSFTRRCQSEWRNKRKLICGKTRLEWSIHTYVEITALLKIEKYDIVITLLFKGNNTRSEIQGAENELCSAGT